MDSLLKIPVSGSGPLLKTLKGMKVLLIGSGGAARSLAFYLAEGLEKGRLFLANRDAEKVKTLCREVNEGYQNAEPLSERDIPKVAKAVDLIVNATTKGQQGLRRLPDGAVTCLEPYSALAPADPPSLRIDDESSFFSTWTRAAKNDIEKNNQASFKLLLDVPPTTLLFDIIYAPLETVFLKQGRWTGHRTLNGKTMNIAQAADAFYEKVVRPLLQEKGLYTQDTYQRLLAAMMAKW